MGLYCVSFKPSFASMPIVPSALCILVCNYTDVGDVMTTLLHVVGATDVPITFCAACNPLATSASHIYELASRPCSHRVRSECLETLYRRVVAQVAATACKLSQHLGSVTGDARDSALLKLAAVVAAQCEGQARLRRPHHS